MKSMVFALLLLGFVALANAGDIVDVDLEDLGIDLDGDAGQSVTGEYRWQSPEGEQFVVRYIADENGFRVLESNAVPRNSDGVLADGTQGDLDGDSNEDDD